MRSKELGFRGDTFERFGSDLRGERGAAAQTVM
jgi:hypothetical protein